MAEIKYVSQANLVKILGKIKETYVAKETGKGLSTNDLTNELLAKINGMGSVATLSEIGESNLSAALREKVNAASEGNHSHLNKELLDTYTQTEADLADAVAKKHAHANAEELNKIAAGDKAKWDQAVTDLAAVVADYLKTSDKEALQALITALDGRVTINEQGIATLNGNSSVEGSVDKKIADAINAWAAQVTDDGTINTYKEALEYIAAHGGEYTTLLGEVTQNKNAIATLNGDASTAGSVAKQVADGDAATLAAAKEYTNGKDTAMGARVKAIEDDYVKASEMVAYTDEEIEAIWASV